MKKYNLFESILVDKTLCRYNISYNLIHFFANKLNILELYVIIRLLQLLIINYNNRYVSLNNYVKSKLTKYSSKFSVSGAFNSIKHFDGAFSVRL